MKQAVLSVGLRVALLYALLGGAWILFSDRLIAASVTDPNALTVLQTYKGWAFVALSALLIFFLLRREINLRTRTENRLRESETRYQLISSVASDYMFSSRLEADGELRLNWVAGAFENITGYTLVEYIARGGWRASVHPDHIAQDERDMEKLRANQRVVTEIRTLTKNGKPMWVRVYAHPVLDQHNAQLVGIYGAVQDITENKHAEEALREKEQQLSLIFDNVSDVLFYLSVEPNEQYRFVSVNQRFLQATGLTAAQIVGQEIRQVIPPPAHELVLGNYQKAIREKRTASWEEISVYPAGKKYAEVSVTPIFDAAGNCTHLVGIIHDITERKEAEEELHQRADAFAALYDTARDLSTQSSLPTLLETITKQTARLLDTADATIYLYDAARDELELAASNVYTFPRGTRFPVGKGVSSQVIRTREPKIVDDYRAWSEHRPEMEHLDYHAVALVPLIHRDEMIGALGVAEIGTERKYTAADTRLLELLAAQAAVAIQNTRLRAELEAYNKELEQRVAQRTAELEIARQRAESADQLKSAFLATMSHELRTPLNSIIGFTGVLLQGLAGPLNPEQAKQMGMARDSARHLLALINDVLDISKIEAGQLEVRRAPFDMRAAIENAMQLVAPQAQKKGLALAAAIGSNVGGVESDQRRVEQILVNLLNNAIKFTEHGEVRLECHTRGDFIETTVRDTGIGIRDADMSKLFEPFRQIETGLNRRHEGTGLGLSICKNLVELLGGQMRVESEWGAGSAFTFTLPLTPHGGAHGEDSHH